MPFSNRPLPGAISDTGIMEGPAVKIPSFHLTYWRRFVRHDYRRRSLNLPLDTLVLLDGIMTDAVDYGLAN
jgi:hypothetical protein